MVLFLVALTAFGPFVTDFYLPAMPSQAVELNASASLTQAGLSASMWGLAIGQLIIGPLSDRKGRKIPLLYSLGVFSVATVGCIIAPSMEFFVAARFIQGLGGAGGIVLAKSIASDLYSGRDLAKFLSVIGAVQGLAPVLGPMCGALVNQYLNWRDIFVVLLAIGLVLFVATLFFKETLAGYRRSNQSLPFSSLFTLVKSDTPFALLLCQQCAGFGLLFAYISASPFLFQNYFGLSAISYSLVFGLNSIMIAVGTFLCQRMKSASDSLKIGSSLMLILSVACAGFIFLAPSVWAVEACLALSLMSLGMTLPSGTAMALDRQKKRAGSAAALLGALGFVVGGLVAPLSGYGSRGEGLAVIIVASTAISLACAFSAIARLKREPATPDTHGEALDLSDRHAGRS